MEEQTTLVNEPVEQEVVLDEEEESDSKNLPLDWEDQLYERGRDKELMKEEAQK